MSWSLHELWLLEQSVNEFQALYVKSYTPPEFDARQARFALAVKQAFQALQELRAPLSALQRSLEFQEANQPLEGI